MESFKTNNNKNTTSDKIVEADYIDKETNRRCIITFNRLGTRCGYVVVSNSTNVHLFYRENIAIIKLLTKTDNVGTFAITMYENRLNNEFLEPHIVTHGGITFANTMTFPFGEDLKVIGIDFAHFDDLPDTEAYTKYFGKNALAKELISITKGLSKYGTVKNLDYIKKELSNLAQQINYFEKVQKHKDKIEKANKWKNKGSRNTWKKR